MALLGHNYLRTFASQATCALPLPLSVWPLLVELTSVSCMAYPTGLPPSLPHTHTHTPSPLAHTHSSGSIPAVVSPSPMGFARFLHAASSSLLRIIMTSPLAPSLSLALPLSCSAPRPVLVCVCVCVCADSVSFFLLWFRFAFFFVVFSK